MGVKTDVMGWAAVLGVVGLMGYAGYRGVRSIFPDFMGGGGLDTGWVSTSAENGPAISTATAQAFQANTQNVARVVEAEDNPEVKRALQDLQREVSEWQTAYTDFQGGNFPQIDYLGDRRVKREWNDVIDAMNEVTRISGGRYVFEFGG